MEAANCDCGPTSAKVCPLCGQGNACAMAAGSTTNSAAAKSACWCTRVEVPPRALIALAEEFPGAGCLCASCLIIVARVAGEHEESATLRAHLRAMQGPDYYIDDDGNLVFTEANHLRRGVCCNNGCRHCPYREKLTEAGRDVTPGHWESVQGL